MDWAPILQTGAGGLIALAGVFAAQWNLRRIEQEKDRRALRDARRNRIRSAYLAVMGAIDEIQRGITEMQVILPGETFDTKLPIVYERLQPSWRDLWRARVELRLETTGEAAAQHVDAITAAFADLMLGLGGWHRPDQPGRDDAFRQITEAQQRFRDARDELQRLAREQLAALDAPL